MQRKDTSNNLKSEGLFRSLLGNPTPAKASGLVFSLSAVIPVILSLVFLVVVGVSVGETAAEQDWYAYANFLLPQLCFAFILICYLKYNGVSLKGAFVSQKCKKRYYIVAVVLQFGLFCLSELNGLFLEFLGNFGYQDSGIVLPSMEGFGFVGVIIVVALLPAVFEECIFRGALLGELRAFGKIGAVLICGALFALYHQNPAQTLYQFCCGVAFALVALKAESVFPTVLAHFINNAIILTLTKFGVVTFSPSISIILCVVSALALVGSVTYLLIFDKKELENIENTAEERKTEGKCFFLYASVGIAVCAFTWFAVLLTGM